MITQPAYTTARSAFASRSRPFGLVRYQRERGCYGAFRVRAAIVVLMKFRASAWRAFPSELSGSSAGIAVIAVAYRAGRMRLFRENPATDPAERSSLALNLHESFAPAVRESPLCGVAKQAARDAAFGRTEASQPIFCGYAAQLLRQNARHGDQTERGPSFPWRPRNLPCVTMAASVVERPTQIPGCFGVDTCLWPNK